MRRANLLLVCRQWARVVRRLQTSPALSFNPRFKSQQEAAAARQPEWPDEPEAAAVLARSLLGGLAQRRITSASFEEIQDPKHGPLLDQAAALVGPTLAHLRLEWRGTLHTPQVLTAEGCAVCQCHARMCLLHPCSHVAARLSALLLWVEAAGAPACVCATSWLAASLPPCSGCGPCLSCAAFRSIRHGAA